MIEKINPKQTALFCSMLIITSKLLTLPSLMYQSNGVASVFSVIFLFLVELFILYFFIKFKEKYNNISIFNYFINKFGKFIAKLIIFILFLFFILKLLFILEEKYSFLKQALYGNATIMVYLICVLPVITALVYKGLRAFGRTLEIFFPFIIVGIIFCTFIWISSVSNFGFDIFNNRGLTGFFDSLFSYTFWFGDFMFFIIIFDKLKIEKNFGKTIMKYSIFTISISVFFYFAFFYIYQSSSFYHTDAFLDIIQFSAELGNVGKLDIISVTTVMFILFFQAGMFLYCAKECLGWLFPFKHKAQPLIVLNIIMVVGMYIIFNNSNLLILVASDYFMYFALAVVYALPLAMYLSSLKKKPKKNIYKKSVLIKN